MAEPLRVGDRLRDADAYDRLIVAPFAAVDSGFLPIAAARAAEHFLAVAAVGVFGELRVAGCVPETAELAARDFIPRQRDFAIEHQQFRSLRAIGKLIPELEPRFAHRVDLLDAVAVLS